MDEDDAIGKVCDEGFDSDVTRCYLVIEPAEVEYILALSKQRRYSESVHSDHLVNVFSCTLTHCFSSSTIAAANA